MKMVPRIVPMPSDRTRIRVLPGPQLERFVEGSLQTLQSAPYTVAVTSDRMGFRLEGPALTHSRGADIISDATPLGALQVPASGLPILLMADRPTTGGYPKVATVISADIGTAGQLGPGDRLSFVVCSPKEALAALIAQERAVMALDRPPVSDPGLRDSLAERSAARYGREARAVENDLRSALARIEASRLESQKQELTGRKGGVGDRGRSPTEAGSSTESHPQRNEHRDEKHRRRAAARATPVEGSRGADAADSPNTLQEPLPIDEPIAEPTEAAR